MFQVYTKIPVVNQEGVTGCYYKLSTCTKGKEKCDSMMY